MTTETKSLQGRVAIVTGGARGIGKAIVEALHARGASVVIADNGAAVNGDGEDANVAQALAKTLGANTIAFTQNMASPAAAQAAVKLALDTFGGVDIIVNNAAILRDAMLFKGNPADWDRVMQNNLSAAYYLLNAATPVLRDQAKSGRGGESYQWGRVVNMLSTAGLYGNVGTSNYASAKGGLFSLTRVTAQEMSRSNVTANAICPFAATRVTDLVPEGEYKTRAQKIDAAHVGGFVAFLCSPEAQAISGQLFGARGREIFLFSQPRPIACVLKPAEGEWTAAQLADQMKEDFVPKFVDLSTDLDAFNYEPVV
ncbi:MAG: SDR family NAD(P)-dependent oxidoreductase [Gammaproteobacteria bacterium]|nr:SDR family NAD(P)-dependent oxidoreductase [Gammaproteobacteria bacterium]